MTLKAMLLSAVVLSVVSSVAFFLLFFIRSRNGDFENFSDACRGVVTFIFVLYVLFFHTYTLKSSESQGLHYSYVYHWKEVFVPSLQFLLYSYYYLVMEYILV